MDPKTIETLILSALPGSDVRVEDPRGDGACYAAYVSSPAFQGKSRVEQHRMVFAAVRNSIGDAVHTLTLQTVVPEG